MTNRIEVVQTYGRRVSRGASSKIRVYVSNLDKERRRDGRKWPSRISNETLPICNRGVSPSLHFSLVPRNISIIEKFSRYFRVYAKLIGWIEESKNYGLSKLRKKRGSDRILLKIFSLVKVLK